MPTPPGSQEHEAATLRAGLGDSPLDSGDWARAEAEREGLLKAMVDYVGREREMMRRLGEQSALLELAPDPIFARDADRRITFWNTAAETTYGIGREDATGRDPAMILQTVYPIPLEEIERLVTVNGYWEGDLIQTTKAGVQITVTSRWGAMYDELGELAGLLEINRDITERLATQAAQERDRAQLQRERMSNRLVRAQRLESLGQLAGGIAHDFNNLLAIILGYSAMGTKQLSRPGSTLSTEDSEKLHQDFAQISEAAERAAGLTHQLLSFARQDTVQADVIDANATLSEMQELLARTLGAHIQLSAELDPDLYPVRIDPGELGQILVNLAVNSRAAMPDGGRLSIETSTCVFGHDQPLSHGILTAGAYTRIRVNDTGAGMSVEVVERAFDPFFTTRAVGEGTGLGLATVYGIVTKAGGQVELYSELGRGTTITILLPAAEGPVTAGPQASRPVPRSARGERVLIVEDEAPLRAIIVANVEDAGYLVISAGGGREALAVAQGAEIDLLLTDVVMPELLGQQLAEELRRRRPGLKLLFMSGFAQTASTDVEDTLPGRLLQKPFSEAELLIAIADVLAAD